MTNTNRSMKVKSSELEAGHILVGSRGGLSEVERVVPSSTMPGMMLVETEHGPIYLDPDEECDVVI